MKTNVHHGPVGCISYDSCIDTSYIPHAVARMENVGSFLGNQPCIVNVPQPSMDGNKCFDQDLTGVLAAPIAQSHTSRSDIPGDNLHRSRLWAGRPFNATFSVSLGPSKTTA
jgi:hypothetical protein